VLNGKEDMKIIIGSDHRGYQLKEDIKNYFATCPKDLLGQDDFVKWNDIGSFSKERSDYPVFAKQLCSLILQKQAEFGILICGSGIGMSIAANRHKGIYAALCWQEALANVARIDDGANVLVLSSDFISKEDNIKIVIAMIQMWLKNDSLKERYQKRLEMLDK